MNVLVVAPHPDDEILGCGGVMARHVRQGDSVHVVVVGRGMAELFSPEEEDECFRELRLAHQLLGGSGVYCLDFPVPRLDTVPGHVLADAIKAVIAEVQAHVVYMPYEGDIHGDHQAVYRATMVAARPVGNSPVRRILCYETLSETDWASPFGDSAFLPTVFVDIADDLQLKLQAMSCYRSQLKAPPHPRSLESIEALARVRGGAAGLAAAEAFALVRAIVD